MNPLRLLLLSFMLLLMNAGKAQSPNAWTYHLSYRNATAVEKLGNTVYGLFNGNLLRYDATDNSVTEIDRFSGLSDKGIRYMGVSTTRRCLVLYYEDNNIDLLYEDGTVVNIPQVKSYTEHTISPIHFTVNGDWALVGTSLGVILLDVAKQEVKGFYYYNTPVYAANVIDNNLYVAFAGRVATAPLTANLYDKAQLHTVYNFRPTAIMPTATGIYFIVPVVSGINDAWQGLSYVTREEGAVPQRLTGTIPTKGIVNEQGAYFAAGKKLLVVHHDTPTTVAQADIPETTLALCPATATDLWMAHGEKGMVSYTYDGEELHPTGRTFGTYGPRRDLSYQVRFSPDGKFYVCGGKPDHSDAIKNTGTLMRYDGNEWTDMDEDALREAQEQRYRNVSDVAFDPADPNHVYATGYSTGLFEFQDGLYKESYTPDNSPIASAAPNSRYYLYYLRTGGVTFDRDGRLWVLQNYTDSVGLVRRTDGTWKKVYISSMAGGVRNYKIRQDPTQNRMWMCVQAETSIKSGICALDYTSTLDSDDMTEQYRTSAVNEDGTTVNLLAPQDFCFDLNGQLWIGCETGVFVVEDPDTWFDTDFTILQPKVPRNDGTNYADYLLTGVQVNAIAVDGGNRKWLGTNGGGLYLVSPDGTQILAHYTADNSPLLSDVVQGLAIDPATGLLFIATEIGLCSYASGVTEPAASLKENDIKVFPNPVRPEYHGLVNITGLTADAEVKIMTTGSQLVATGRATGGSYQWNGRNAAGHRVGSGVYYLLVTTANGSTSVVAKIVVI